MLYTVIKQKLSKFGIVAQHSPSTSHTILHSIFAANFFYFINNVFHVFFCLLLPLLLYENINFKTSGEP